MSSANGRPVRIRITEIMGGGSCPVGLDVGQVWEVVGEAQPEGMCAWAYNAMLPFIAALRFGGTFPWSGEKRVRLCCPDADNPVVFELDVIE